MEKRISPLEREFGREESQFVEGNLAKNAPKEKGYLGSPEDRRLDRLKISLGLAFVLSGPTIGAIGAIIKDYCNPFSYIMRPEQIQIRYDSRQWEKAHPEFQSFLTEDPLKGL